MEIIKPNQICFLDIETVPQYKNYNQAPEYDRYLWDKKARFIVPAGETAESVYSRAGIYAEFGKIICISTGFITLQNNQYQFHVKSFYRDNEKELLQEFIQYLKKQTQEKKQLTLCAHNGKEFDFPYLIRRMLVNSLPVPDILNLSGKKPWEVNHIDTLEMWKFGDYKNFTSLELLAHIFGIKSPKDDIDGSKVAEVYYTEKNVKRIVDYCQRDVITLALLYLKMKGDLTFDEHSIDYL